MAKHGEIRAIHFEIFVESEMSDEELHQLAKQTSLTLSEGCNGRFLITIGVLRPNEAANLWDVATKLRDSRAKSG